MVPVRVPKALRKPTVAERFGTRLTAAQARRQDYDRGRRMLSEAWQDQMWADQEARERAEAGTEGIDR